MESIVFLFGVVGIVVVVVWSIRNDRVPLHGRTEGLLAMRDPEPPGTPAGEGRPAETTDRADRRPS